MFYRFKIFAENLFDKFIWPQLPPHTNLATVLALTIAIKFKIRTYLLIKVYNLQKIIYSLSFY